MRVFITGGTGLIGRRLVRHLCKRGDSCVVLTRNATAARRTFPAEVACVEGDPTEAGPWQQAVRDADAVVNLAGEPLFRRRWTKRQKEWIVASRIRGTGNVAEAMTHAGRARVLVSASGVGYYGMRGDEEVTEDDGPGADFLANLAIAWESATDKAAAAGARVVPLRIGVVLAPEGGALPQMSLPFRLHVGGPIGNGVHWVSWVHIEDMVAIIAFALDQPSLAGPINACSPNPVANREFAKALGAAMGRKSWLPTPRLMLRIALGEVADLAARGQRVLPSRLRQAGYRFRHPTLPEALQHILGSHCDS